MKLDVLMHYEVNEQTGEIQFLGKEEVTVDTAKKTSTPKTLGGDDPKLVLESNKYALNGAACKLLNVEPGVTLYINYPKKDGRYVPVIGTSEAFGVKSGNKLTKGLTVSYRGAANEKLAEYGTNFEFVESEHPGIYYLKGDKIVSGEQKAAIEIDESFELDDLEDIALDLEESTDISTIDLTL